jgi:hypothetical protein
VVAVLPSARRTYARALVDTLDFLCDGPSAVPVLASGVGPVNDLKRRLSMILRGTTPRGLGLGGALTVLAVAALLPLWPRWAEAQQPPAAAPAQNAQEEARRLEAELQRLQADLQQRLAEVKKLEAKLHEAARARAEQAVQEQRDTVRRRVEEARDQARTVAETARRRAEERGRRAVIMIELRGLGEKPEALQEVLEAIKKALPQGVSISMGDGRELNLRIERPAAGDGRRAAPAQPATPPRAGDVERRLEELQRSLEELRREIQNPRDGSRRESPSRGGAPAPPAPPAPPAAPAPPRPPERP